MNDASTTQPGQADGAHVADGAAVEESDAGHGRHRGPVGGGDGAVTPRGRHRKPAGETGEAEAAA
ncbi:hypothetical protein ACGFZL_00615 [Streptomyces sp. NPDC048182]|uniref:hypothetical protein n=1 Tax=unclassified Streptomyces TaxID=2593676 RepID=UPI0033B51FB5